MSLHGIERAPEERINWVSSAAFLAAHALVLLTFVTGITPTAVILFVGLTRLALLHGWAQAVEWGLAPFWKGALVKILLGAIIAWWFRCSVCFSGLRRG